VRLGRLPPGDAAVESVTLSRVLSLGALSVLLPLSPLAGQAVCSAPHSSPTLSQSGAIRTLEPGSGWIQLSGYAQNATESFNPEGTRQPFVTGAEFRTRSAFLTAAVGVAWGLELWAQLPLHDLAVEGPGGSSDGDGVGDLRFAARLGSDLVGLDLPVALRAGVKVPGSDFPVDARLLPLSEGQTDVEVSVETGRSVGALPIYWVGWLGYRWRFENETADREPGDEWFAHAAVGGGIGRFSWEIGSDVLRGRAPRAQGFSLDNEQRRLVLLVPTVGYGFGPGRLEATVQHPLSGRNLPAATGLSIGYRALWGF
ncbi:MAG: transporter, partial [Gemmatimonadetes bacterium]|nr:transporter [Gemmatimonadota bacterium]